MLDNFWAANTLVDWMLRKPPEPGPRRSSVRGELIPRWINFLSVRVDRFDRCPEMIDHGSGHVANLLCLAADMLSRYFVKKRRKKDDGEPPRFPNGADLLALICGIFLHDIGMSDLGPGETRKRHGAHSHKMLLEKRASGDRREDLLPGFSDEELEIIGLICEYHQKAWPLDGPYVELLRGKGKEPLEKRTLVSRLPGGGKPMLDGQVVDAIKVAALLQFIDACDVQYSRAGSLWLARLKKETNDRAVCESSGRERLFEKLEKHGRVNAGYVLRAGRGGKPHQWFRPNSTREAAEALETERAFQKHLKGQCKSHYPKHLGIEKVWLLGDGPPGGDVVAKLADIETFEKMGSSLGTECDPGKALDGLRLDVRGEWDLVGPYIGEVFELGSVRRFDANADLERITGLPHYEKAFSALPPRPKSRYLPRTRAERAIRRHVGGGGRILAVIGPRKSGKTRMVLEVLRPMKGSSGRSLWPADIFYMNLTRGVAIEEIVLALTRFLALGGEFLFYNKLLMEQRVQESQWDLLLDQIDREGKVLCFDSCNHLPLRNKASVEYRFFRKLLTSVTKARIILAGTILPAAIDEDIRKRVAMVHVPAFSEEERSLAASPAWKKLWGRFKGGSFDEEAMAAVRVLLDSFPLFPCVFEAVSGEIDVLVKQGKRIDSAAIVASAEAAAGPVRQLLRKEVFLGLGSDMERDLVCLLAPLDAPFAFDPAGWEAELKWSEEQLENAWRDLVKRGLARTREDGRCEIDGWWGAIL